MEKRIIELLNKVFEDVEINEGSSMDNIETWDSMNQLNIAFEIENEFGISLEPEELPKLISVSSIVDLVKDKIDH